MAGDMNGTQESQTTSETSGTQDAQEQGLCSQMSESVEATENGREDKVCAVDGNLADSNTVGDVKPGATVAHEDFKAQLQARDAEITRLKEQVATAAQTVKATDELNAKIAELEEKAERERVDFELKLAGCRSTRAGRALLDEHDGDIEALKAAEPWLFQDERATVSHGATGLPNAGAAKSDDAVIAHWREIAGLGDE